jgi:ribokinase
MYEIICFGSAGKDIFFPTSGGDVIETPDDLTSQKKIAFELGAKIKIENRFESLGGCAANVAVGLSRLGIKATCVSNIGDDAMGEWIIDELKNNNIGVDFISKDVNKKSDLSAILVDEKSADRVIFTNKNSSGKLKLNREEFGDAKWFFISDVHGNWEFQVEEIIKMAQEEKKHIAFNPREVCIQENSQKVISFIRCCELVFLNKDEAIEIISQIGKFSAIEMDDENFLLKEVRKLGVGVIALTDGVRGAWASDGSEIYFISGREVNAVDSTGAGDAFASGFLGAYFKEKTLKECLEWGIANSSHEVQFYGAIEGLLDEKNISKI